jgi:uncharacterized repeat protein (TIGR01451 family)
MDLRSRGARALALTGGALLLTTPLVSIVDAPGASARAGAVSDDAHLVKLSKGALSPAEAEGPAFQAAREAYYADRVYSGSTPLSVEQVAHEHGKAAAQAQKLGGSGSTAGAAGSASGPAWATIGPTSTQQVARTSRTVENVAGRVSALAQDHAGRIYLGAAGGGVWRYDPTAKTWTALTDSLPTLAVGAIAIDPSNDSTLYLGTGEGDLSGDSHYGDGIWRSTNAGKSWRHVGLQSDGSYAFDTSTISRLIVQPTATGTAMYVTTIRGRGGSRRVSPPTNQTWGVWRSNDLGAHWKLLKGTTDPSHGATDLEVDPNNVGILYATFWGDGIYKSSADGSQWSRAMTGLPDANYAGGGTRIAISTVKLGTRTRLYAGFDWYDQTGAHHPSQLFRSDDGAAHWAALPTTGENGAIDSVADYCATQCTYDNVVEADPSSPDVVYAGGQYNYGLASGGIYRSVDGGLTWQSLGFDLHPDFHALAFQPGNPAHVVIGNDGGAWQSPDRGHRAFTGGSIADVNWENLNAGLTITQFSSIDYSDPAHPNRFYGGTQDNGTQRKSSGSNTWFDQPGGDGGQVLVDHNDTTGNAVFGEYYGISPYRYNSINFGDISGIGAGIDASDRSEFYVPWVMNQANGNQLFYGTYRLYRTDNAETANAGDVRWKPISGDLTSGCTGAAPNGGRNCSITALGHSEGGTAAWVGTQEGYVWVAPDAGTSDTPHWTRVDTNGPGGQLANRPVGSFAVDRSNWRIAYVSYEGYNAATPGHAGHVFKTTDGGAHWADVTGNLPDGPVNTLVLNPSNANEVVAGTDFGAFVADVGAASPSWTSVGSALPAVQVEQLAYDSSRALLVAGTHGRGAWRLGRGTSAPALAASTTDAGTPVGPGKDLAYTVTVKNEGNAPATVTITAPIPASTTFKAAQDGGALRSGHVTWTGVAIPAGGSAAVHYTVTIDPSLPAGTTEIVSDGLTVSGSGVSTSGSPHSTPIAPAHAVTAATATPKDGTTPGASVTYPVTLTNPAYNDDTFAVAATSANHWTTSVLQADCTTAVPAAGTPVASGGTATVCVKVAIPATGVTETQPDAETVTVTSTGGPGVSKELALTTLPVTTTALVVDGDGNAPDVQSHYTSALTAAQVSFAVWDLSASRALGLQYLSAHRDAYYFSGSGYPGPLAPYEALFQGYLDHGGNLLVSGIDILDQAAGTTPFVHDYLHVAWDGSESRNDKGTATVSGEPGSALGNGLTSTPLVRISGLCACEDETVPVLPATVQFRDDGVAAGSPQPDGIAVTDTSVATGKNYRVVFLGFPLEEFGAAADQVTLAGKVNAYFGG